MANTAVKKTAKRLTTVPTARSKDTDEGLFTNVHHKIKAGVDAVVKQRKVTKKEFLQSALITAITEELGSEWILS